MQVPSAQPSSELLLLELPPRAPTPRLRPLLVVRWPGIPTIAAVPRGAAATLLRASPLLAESPEMVRWMADMAGPLRVPLVTPGVTPVTPGVWR